ncbi:nicotinate-nucleotide adenylyltransferase [Microbaculum sp. FT89]|uniref:nicotinate-nucleotide adenylyltransferase n=1 Tax=Microbaculum sp. FT89 TaxID=3447298 RepID=UPI003F535483
MNRKSATRRARRPDTSPVWPALPPYGSGQRIGLLGGSFNPPHAGHRLISELALHRLRLDAVWWLVTPGNPLKDPAALRPMAERIAEAGLIARHPRIRVTSVEADVGVSRTRDTLRFLTERCPTLRFVWLMGADNLPSFHRWHAWQEIAGMVPIAVIDRPGNTLHAAAGRAASWLSRYRVDESDAATLADRAPPAWVFLHGRRSPLSSTQLRGSGRAETAPSA